MKKKIACLSLLAVLTAPMALAQSASGNPNYPIMVQGANGLTYFCRPNPVTANTLSCIDPAVQRVVRPQTGGLGSLGGTTGLVLGGVGLLGLVAVAVGGSSSGT
ncbi:MAG: hypothetical protein ACPG5U_06295 [Planktomarina sp.]